MKTLKYTAAAIIATAMTACSLDEVYKTQLDQDVVYNTVEGYKGLVNACYENLYYLYGKEDGIAMLEMGDLWQNGSSTGGAWKECVNNIDWSTETGVNRVIWNAMYATVAYCNTAIYYKDKCTGSDSISLDAKAAEAYFMRAFSYLHIVEQWGGVTLTTTSMAQEGAREFAYRNTEEEIYDQIMSDLLFAYNNLPASQGEERGRANKYTAAALLTKAWMQRSRLERDFRENPEGKLWASIVTDSTAVKYTATQCADSAFKYAEIVINESPYKLYASTAERSGSNIEWDGENNKNNQEFIMVEAIDHENGYNPEAWNRGRTRQYYLMSIGSSADDFGVTGEGLRYGRANTTRVHPTLYLLNDCFDPKPGKKDVANAIYVDNRNRETTPDTRFDDSFYYKYFIGSSSMVVPYDLLRRCGKDTVFLAQASRRTITGNVVSPEQAKAKYPGLSYYADNGALSADYKIEIEDNPLALGCYTPNFPVDSAWAAKKKYLVAGLPVLDNNTALTTTGTPVNPGRFVYFSETGAGAKDSYHRSLSPSLKKLSPIKYCYTNQQSLNDFPIIRLTDIYLLAAEAAVISGHNQAKGLEYLNAVRKHAALSTDADKMTVGSEAMNIDFLAKERARELCGENWRWYDLKRMGLLTPEYLNGPRRNIYAPEYQLKWRVRPIPQQLLDQIANPEEYGTNGY